MFKFKMLTKVLVAVFVLGQLIESNLKLCIALSIDLDAPASNVKLHKAWQSIGASALDVFPITHGPSGDPDGAGLASASHTLASTPTATAATGSLSGLLPVGNESQRAQAEGAGAESERLNISQTLESNGRLSYFGKIYVGERRVPFMVLVDLTSSAFWLPSSDCISFFCISRQKYNRSESATHQELGRELEWTYNRRQQGEARVSARLVRDQVNIGGVTIEGQTFGEAIEMSGEPFAHLPVDGFLGLGFRRLDSRLIGDNSPPFERLYSKGLLREPIFSLLVNSVVDEWKYSADNGELILGQLADGYQAADLTYVPVTHSDYWEFRLTSVSLRQAYGIIDIELACESACPAIVDTGTTYISGHHTDVDRLNKAMGGYAVGNGLYRLSHCDLSLMPDLIFNIGGAEFSLAPEDHVIVNRVRGNVVSCYSGLRVIEADQSPFWVLGEQFLKRHYVVFDYGQERLGFAKSKSIIRDTEVDLYGQTRRKKQHII